MFAFLQDARTKLMLVYEQLRVLDLSWDGALTGACQPISAINAVIS
jgi:hypothetical protein